MGHNRFAVIQEGVLLLQHYSIEHFSLGHSRLVILQRLPSCYTGLLYGCYTQVSLVLVLCHWQVRIYHQPTLVLLSGRKSSSMAACSPTCKMKLSLLAVFLDPRKIFLGSLLCCSPNSISLVSSYGSL